MQLIKIDPVEISPGISASGLSISTIIPHTLGVTVFFNQGFSVIISDMNSEDGYGDYTLDKEVGDFTISDIISVVPLAVYNKFPIQEDSNEEHGTELEDQIADEEIE